MALSLCLFGLSTAIPIVEIVIATQYKDSHTDCDNSLLLPTTWLFISAIVSFALLIIEMPIGIQITRERQYITEGCKTPTEQNPFVITLRYLSFIFSIVWTIIGAVILFRDNMDCGPYSLHVMMMFSVITRLIALTLLTCCELFAVCYILATV